MTEMNAGEALQRAVLGEMLGHRGVRDYLGTKFYDRVPEDAVKPYGNFGEYQAVEDGADGLDDAESQYLTLHVWSDAVGALEAKAICAAIKKALNRRTVPLDGGHGTVELRVNGYRILPGGDGLTTHGVITVETDIDG